MRRSLLFFILLITHISFLYAAEVANGAKTEIINESTSEFRFSIDLPDPVIETSLVENSEFLDFSIADEGYTQLPGMPKLPAVSRYIIVPSQSSVELSVIEDGHRNIRAVSPPLPLENSEAQFTMNQNYYTDGELYPPETVVLHDPVLIRNVRMVMVTVYPIQYDPVAQSYIQHDNLEIELRYGDAEPVNPARVDFQRIPSPDFQRMINAVALNSLPRRDPRELVEMRGYHDYYLFVMPDMSENIQEHAYALVYRLMEWKRQSGNKVELLRIEQADPNPNITEDAIQERYDELIEAGIEPFDHILLIGEDERTPYRNNQHGQGMAILMPGPTSQFATEVWVDHWDIRFGYLEGDDQFPDVSVSRFHSGDLATLACGVNKTISYESAPYWDDTDWYTEAVVEEQAINGADEGMTRTVDYYVEALEQNGFDVVAQFRRAQDGGDPGPWLADQVNERIGLICGRAKNYNIDYVWGNTPQNMFDVVGAFPIAILNSGHGEWAMETLFWVGREWYTRPERYNSLEGAKGAVAATCTWSRPETTQNNCLGAATVHGFVDMQLQFGWARVFTALAFNRSFPGNENQYIKYTEDHTFCGDPGIVYWRGVPQRIEVEHPDMLEEGNNLIPVVVTDEDDNEAVADIMVTLYQGDIDGVDLFQIAYTDEDGYCEFYIDPEIEGSILITALERDVYPYKGEIGIESADVFVRADILDINDAEGGNGNGVVNPGETLLLTFSAANLGTEQAAVNARGRFESASSYLEFEGVEIEFGNIDPQSNVENDTEIEVIVAPDCPDGEDLAIRIEMEAENGSWTSAVIIDPVYFNIEVGPIPDGGVIPLELSDFNLDLRNIGRLPSEPFTARLLSGGWEVGVVNSTAEYPAIPPGQLRSARDGGFRISGNIMAVPGNYVPMALAIEVGGEVVDSAYFHLMVGEPREGAPQGPDDYGYICFDDTDTDYDQAPEYDWVEISARDNDADLDGDLLDIEHGTSSNGWGVVDLPFDFQYYGEDFDQITICTNGFISMGVDDNFVPNFQNWPLDGGGFGGGYGKIAPLWDDLTVSGQNNPGIWTTYDEQFGRFIIEYYNVHRSGYFDNLRFQIQLFNPAVWANATGDGKIIFVYHTVSMQPGALPTYSSVGITSPGNTTGIPYTSGRVYPVTSAPIEDHRSLLFTTAPRNITGRIFGQVTDYETGNPINGAVVYTSFGQVSIADAEGRWEIGEALALEFMITAARQGYNDSTRVYELEEDGEIEINFALLHPEFSPSTDHLDANLMINESIELQLNLLNTGNGPLNWSVTRELQGEANADPWTYRRGYNIGIDRNDPRIQGVVFSDDRFYIAGAADGMPQIYIYSFEGEYIGSFDQFVEDRRGMRDLAFDGELIWGAFGSTIYGFTTEGDLITSFEGPYNPITNITYDSDLDVLWTSSTTTNFKAVDREGNIRDDLIIDRQGLRVYGLAYWSEDPEECNLYAFYKDQETDQQAIAKFDTESGEMSLVHFLMPENGGTPQAAYITNQFDVYSWVLLTVVSNAPEAGGDRVDVWQLDSRKDWMSVDPEQGLLNTGEVQEFTVVLDATGLPVVEFVGDLVFRHNAIGGETRIELRLNVEGGEGMPARRILNLEPGWGMVSLNVEPLENDIRAIMRPVVDAEALVILKDGLGRFYLPGADFNNIPGWNVFDGYQINITEPMELSVEGMAVEADTPIPLSEGWNMKAYLPRNPVDAVVALSGIEDDLLIAKDWMGLFYLPEHNFSNMGDLREGHGYQYKVRNDVDLIYQVDQNQVAAVDRADKDATPSHFEQPLPTGANMSVLVIGSPEFAGYEIGVRSPEGDIAGAGVIDSGGRCGIAVQGGNQHSEDSRGLSEGEGFGFVVWDGHEEIPATVKFGTGSAIYQTDGMAIGDMVLSGVPERFELTGIYPNPFNSRTRISFALPEAGLVKVSVFDLAGREVVRLADDGRQAGYQTLTWNAASVTSGLYFVRVVYGGEVRIAKVMLLK